MVDKTPEPIPLETFKQEASKSIPEDADFKPLLKVDKLIIKYITSTASHEPTILSNQIVLWDDSTHVAHKYYLKANFNGTSKKIELT